MPNVIERVEIFGVKVPLIGTFISGGISKAEVKCVVLRLTASDGTVGISSLEPSASAKPPHTAVDFLATLRERVSDKLVGQDPLNVHQIMMLMDVLAPEQRGVGVVVEMACVDLACHMLNIPVHTYLGGAVTEKVEFNAWIGMLPPDEAAIEAKRWLKAGFLSAKIKVGSGVLPDAERVAAVRGAVGSAMKLRIDANCQYDADTSLELCKLVKQYDLQLFEQPVPKNDIAGMVRVRSKGGIPIMADETIDGHESLLKVIKAGAADYVKFGVEQAGGILRATRMLATAEAAGLPVVVGHGFGLDPSTIAEIMLASTARIVVPGLECVGPLKFQDTVATSRLDISKGHISLPLGAGIGISLDEHKLERYGIGKI